VGPAPGPGRDLLPGPWRDRLRALPADFPPHQTVYALVPPVDPRAGVVPERSKTWRAIVKRPDQAKSFVLLHRRWVVKRSFAWLTKFPPPRTRLRDPPSHPRSHDLDRRHLAAQQPPHPLTQFTDALLEDGEEAGELHRSHLPAVLLELGTLVPQEEVEDVLSERLRNELGPLHGADGLVEIARQR